MLPDPQVPSVPLPERMVPMLPDPQGPSVPQAPLPEPTGLALFMHHCGRSMHHVPSVPKRMVPMLPDPQVPSVPLPERMVPMLPDPQVPSVPQVPLPEPTGLAPVKANVIANAKEIPVQCFILTLG